MWNNHGFYGVSNTFCQEKHQHFHADRQLVTKKEISIKINLYCNVKRPCPSGLVTGISRWRAGFHTQREQVVFFLCFVLFCFFCFFNLTTWMRVFSQINNCQQKQQKQKQNKNKTKQKTDKTKRGAPPLGLAKSIYYLSNSEAIKRIRKD